MEYVEGGMMIILMVMMMMVMRFFMFIVQFMIKSVSENRVVNWYEKNCSYSQLVVFAYIRLETPSLKSVQTFTNGYASNSTYIVTAIHEL